MKMLTENKDTTALSLYECRALVEEMELIAEHSDGELSEEQLKLLVEAQTRSIVKLQGLCGAIVHYEQGVAFCVSQEKRIAEARQRAEKRIESIKKYLLPYVKEQGKPVTAGTFTLSTRKSTQTIITGTIYNPDYQRMIPARVEPDKNKIKEALQSGKEVKGAELQTNYSLQIK